MVNLYLSSPIKIFLLSLPVGFIIGFLFDCFRFLRIAGFNTRTHTFLQDVSFSIISSIIIFIFSYCTNQGVYRLYIFIGAILSFVIYYNTLSRVFSKISSLLISAIHKFLWFLYKNILIRTYISLDKFYKKGKIIIEIKNKRKYEKKIFAVLKG